MTRRKPRPTPRGVVVPFSPVEPRPGEATSATVAGCRVTKRVTFDQHLTIEVEIPEVVPIGKSEDPRPCRTTQSSRRVEGEG